MMRPEKASFYVYAEEMRQVEELERALLKFVSKQYEKGVLVTAPRLTTLLDKIIDNPIATELLK